jgi:hypothetical protein
MPGFTARALVKCGNSESHVHKSHGNATTDAATADELRVLELKKARHGGDVHLCHNCRRACTRAFEKEAAEAKEEGSSSEEEEDDFEARVAAAVKERLVEVVGDAVAEALAAHEQRASDGRGGKRAAKKEREEAAKKAARREEEREQQAADLAVREARILELQEAAKAVKQAAKKEKQAAKKREEKCEQAAAALKKKIAALKVSKDKLEEQVGSWQNYTMEKADEGSGGGDSTAVSGGGSTYDSPATPRGRRAARRSGSGMSKAKERVPVSVVKKITRLLVKVLLL